MLKVPSSQPESMRWGAGLFHEITFTSLLWALTLSTAFSLRRASQIFIVLSTEHEANTSFSFGLYSQTTQVFES